MSGVLVGVPGPLVLVGELNPYGGDPAFALYHLPRGASGDRLREHLGLEDAAYERLDKMNLCVGTWGVTRARQRAGQVLRAYRTVVCLGARVREAFGGPEFFAIARRGPERGQWRQTIASLPHPSGRNLLWNEPGARGRARRLMMDIAPWLYPDGIPPSGDDDDRRELVG